MKPVMGLVKVVAPAEVTVLILDKTETETETRKELVARAIHRMSPRRNLPFITLNCATISTGRLAARESEFFTCPTGHRGRDSREEFRLTCLFGQRALRLRERSFTGTAAKRSAGLSWLGEGLCSG